MNNFSLMLLDMGYAKRAVIMDIDKEIVDIIEQNTWRNLKHWVKKQHNSSNANFETGSINTAWRAAMIKRGRA